MSEVHVSIVVFWRVRLLFCEENAAEYIRAHSNISTTFYRLTRYPLFPVCQTHTPMLAALVGIHFVL